MEDFEKELKLDFLEEATQLLETTEQAFLQLENDLHNKELIDEIFRFAHNLKGTSRAVGFGVVAEFTHEVENLILKIKQDEVEINEVVVSVLLECNDHINHMITNLKEDFDQTFDGQELVQKISKAVAGEFAERESAQEDVTESHGDFEVSEDLINKDLLAEIEAMQNTSGGDDGFEDLDLSALNVFEGKEKLSPTENSNVMPISEGKSPAKTNKPNLKEDKKVEIDETIRVSLSRVETLNNFVGELVILQSVLEQQKYHTITDELAIKSIGQLNKLCNEIQDISMSLRMVPVKSTLQKMSRIVRDTSKTLNKTVNLHLQGEETEIDKTVLELLADPLVHIVRNAVDHGLEDTVDRLKVGKDEKGNVTIKAYHEGNNLVIEVRDDGKGINPEIIKAKAIEKGIISSTSAISDEEVIQLIFHPGFSTKEEVSEVSGRGVGMDVVKTNIEKLSGSIRVDTELGSGSVFRIALPLTMAIIDGMIIQVGDEKFVIPITQVQESLKPQVDDLHFATGLGHCLNLRGNVLPVKKISELLRLNDQGKELHEQIVIITNSKQGPLAIAVDDILKQQQVVIKKLGNEIRDQKGFMGSSILGDGKPAFIIDVEDLVSIKNNNSAVRKMSA